MQACTTSGRAWRKASLNQRVCWKAVRLARPSSRALQARCSQSAGAVGPYQAVVSSRARPAVRVGWSAANCKATQPPIEAPPTTTAGRPRWSTTSRRSCAMRAAVTGPSARPERP